MLTDQEIQEYYIEATKDARVNDQQDLQKNKKSKKRLLLIINLLLLVGIISYFSYTYFQNKNISLKKTSVLGVTYTSNNESQKLKEILEKIEADTLSNNELNEIALQRIVNDASHTSAYIESLNKEILSKEANSISTIVKNTEKRSPTTAFISDDVTIIVHDGDTLRTLAAKYYGDSQAYTKILRDNPNIDKQSKKIYAGQIIKLSY